VVLTTILLTGCPDDIGAKYGDDSTTPQGGFPDAPEGGGLSPVLVQYALLNEMINFTAAPGRESPNGDYDYEWEASYEGMPTSTEGDLGYVFDVRDATSGVGDTKFEDARCTIHFTKAAEWTVTVRIIGASGTDEEVSCGVYSALVMVRSIRIDPSEITNGEVGKTYTFTAEVVGSSLPEGSYTYKWQISYLGDNPLVFGGGGTTSTNYMRYYFDDVGNYSIRVNVTAGGKTITGESQVTITHLGLSIKAPDESPLVTNSDYTFIAESTFPKYLPLNPYYHWDFGDETGLVVPLFNEVTHAFTEDGQYTIKVELRESEEADAPVLASATAVISVEPGSVNFLSYIQKTTHLYVGVRGDTTYHQSDGYTSYAEGRTLSVYSGQPTTSWDGTHFTNQYFMPPTDSSGGITVTIEGDVSEQGDKVFNLTATVVYDDAHRLAGEERETRISIVNVTMEPKSPIPSTYDPNYMPQFTGYIEGQDVANFVRSTFYEHRQPKTTDPNFKMWYDPLEFTGTNFTPYLLIVFKTYRIDAWDDPGYPQRDY